MYEGAKNNSTINQSISPTKEKLNFSFIDSLIDSLVESIDEEIKDIITVFTVSTETSIKLGEGRTGQ